eukprot:scaffold266407_cov45-Prasinocladus_malaysianus.AAC.2
MRACVPPWASRMSARCPSVLAAALYLAHLASDSASLLCTARSLAVSLEFSCASLTWSLVRSSSRPWRQTDCINVTRQHQTVIFSSWCLSIYHSVGLSPPRARTAAESEGHSPETGDPGALQCPWNAETMAQQKMIYLLAVTT